MDRQQLYKILKFSKKKKKKETYPTIKFDNNLIILL